MSRLSSKVVIVTGGGSGIGRATAILFAAEGARVTIADRIISGGEETVRIIKAAGGDAIPVKADVSKSEDIENLIKTNMLTYGQLDVLFNNAGIEQPIMAIADTPEEVWDKLINTNLKGVFLGMKYSIPHMLERGGVIINTASSAGLHGFPHQSAYAVSKAGIIELTKSAALEYGEHNIRINCICPGAIQTPLIERTMSSPEWAAIQPFRSPSVMGRRGTPEEIAQAALFLASDESASYITGTALVVDGGVCAV